MVDLLKATQKLRRRMRTPRDFMEAEPIGLPRPQVVTCVHSLLGELFSVINNTMYCYKTWVLLRLHLHTLFVRFHHCTGPTRLLLWFVIPQIAISDCLYPILACVLESLAGTSLLGEVIWVSCSVDNHQSSGAVIARELIYSVGALGSSTL
jgi:hypothetical protein